MSSPSSTAALIAGIDRAIEEPILLQFQKFVVSSASCKMPRDREFLTKLIRDAFYLVFLVGHKIAADVTAKRKDDELSQDVNVIANFLVRVLNECRRLEAFPDRCLTPSTKEAFLTKIGSLCSVIRSIGEIAEQNDTFMWHAWNRDIQLQKHLHLDPYNDRPQLFHPDRKDAKNPWNTWLDNSVCFCNE